MNRKWKTALWISAGLVLAALLIGPLVVPIPPLEGTSPPQELADPDSRFIEVNGISVHYKETGSGETTFLLLHGFGASTFTWREVMEPLGVFGRVIAFDRPAFGLTERPLREAWGETNPYTPEAQVALAVALLDALGVEKAVWIGNSAGGTVALNAALQHPERVESLILVDAAVYLGGGAPEWVRPILNTPQLRRVGPLIARRLESQGEAFIRLAWHDPAGVTPEVIAGYRLPLQAENWDRAIWELTLASEDPGLDSRLAELSMPVLVLTGDDDRIVPTEQSIRLAGEIPGAELVVIPESGHLPHEETPGAFLEAVISFITG